MQNLQAMINQFQQFQSNPVQFLAQRRLNIPPQMLNNPQGAIQQLMNNGQMSQQQYTQLSQMANQLQQNPAFRQLLGR